MIDTNSIAVAVGQLRPVINKTGNSGRAVRRALEGRFYTHVDGNAVGHVTVRSDLGGLAFAYLAKEARRAAQLATEHAADMGQAGLKFAVVEVDTSDRRIVIEMTVDAMPESMVARQEFISVVVGELELIAQHVERTPQVADKILFQLFSEGNTLAAVKSQRYLELFYSLVGGDFSNLSSTPVVLVELATELNPEVKIRAEELDLKNQREADDEKSMMYDVR
jgi:hypothetical protein